MNEMKFSTEDDKRIGLFIASYASSCLRKLLFKIQISDALPVNHPFILSLKEDLEDMENLCNDITRSFYSDKPIDPESKL